MNKRKMPPGDVAWSMPGKKRPFAYSTVATSDLIKVLYDEYGDLRDVYVNIRYDQDAKRIVKTYIENGVYEVNLR